jgi:hypothetical protein
MSENENIQEITTPEPRAYQYSLDNMIGRVVRMATNDKHINEYGVVVARTRNHLIVSWSGRTKDTPTNKVFAHGIYHKVENRIYKKYELELHSVLYPVEKPENPKQCTKNLLGRRVQKRIDEYITVEGTIVDITRSGKVVFVEWMNGITQSQRYGIRSSFLPDVAIYDIELILTEEDIRNYEGEKRKYENSIRIYNEKYSNVGIFPLGWKEIKTPEEESQWMLRIEEQENGETIQMSDIITKKIYTIHEEIPKIESSTNVHDEKVEEHIVKTMVEDRSIGTGVYRRISSLLYRIKNKTEMIVQGIKSYV